ncbi:MAG: hypothetical protein R3227_04765 [Reinekea sp.]|nr:hypothetical protein [Reinekea sp.]
MTTINVNRRQFLSTGLKASAGIALAVSGGVVYKALREDVFSPIDGPAFQPWLDFKHPQPGVIGMVQAAILAANPHNTQPWRFAIQPDRVVIYADLERNLGSFDPFRREMTLGLGCAIENLCLAAHQQGMTADVQYQTGTLAKLPALTGTLIMATIHLQANDKQRDPLYDAIGRRHTNRFPYTATPLPAEFLTILQKEARAHDVRLDLIGQGNQRREFDALMIDSTQWIINDPEMIHDSHRWFRNRKNEVNEHRDGPFMDGVGLPKSVAAIAKMLPPTDAEKAHALWLSATRDKHLPNAPVVGVISLKDRFDIKTTLIAGRCWQRFHLQATQVGVACQPMNQPIEWSDRLAQLDRPNIAEQRLQALLGTRDWQATFSFRMGYATTTGVPSPRRSLNDRLI